MERPPRRIDFLDHVRGIAVIFVLAVHAVGAAFKYDRLPWHGWHVGLPAEKSFLPLAPLAFGVAAVPMFFIVSGFCIHLSFSWRPYWKEFWIRRSFRIYPPYLPALLLFALIFPWTRLHFQSPHDLVQLGTHLALVFNFGNSTYFGINSSFWTIAVEAQLYLLYPVLLFLQNRWGWKNTLIVVGLIELGLRVVAGVYLLHAPDAIAETKLPKLLIGCPFYYWLSWSLGAYLAEAYVKEKPLPFVNIPLSALAAAVVVPYAVKPLASFSFTLFSLLTAVVIARLLNRDDVVPAKPQGPFSNYVARLGLWSYSIYLIHQPILLWTGFLLRMHLPAMLRHDLFIFVVLLAICPLIVWLAGFWYRGLEAPSIEWGKRFVRWYHPRRVPLHA